MRINKSFFLKAILFVLIYLNSGALWSNTQLFNIEYLQEIYLSLLVFWSGLYLADKMNLSKKMTSGEAFILILVLFLIVTPAIFSYLNFGQPIYYGFIEERRALSYLIFFPLYQSLSNRTISPIWVINSVLVVCVINGINSIWYFMDIKSQYVIDTINTMNARYDRTIIGSYYMLFAYIYLYWNWLKMGRYINLPFILLIIVYFILFVQTKQILAVVLGLTFILILLHLKRSVWLICAALISFEAIYLIVDIGIYYEKYDVIIYATLSNEATIRSATASSIIQDLSDNLFIFGKGSLSALWNGGFHPIFGDNFFLSDVGILGTYYRFGVLALPLSIFYYSFFMKSYFDLGNLRADSIPIAAISFVICSMFLNILTPVIEYNGFYMAICLALLVTYRKIRVINCDVSNVQSAS